VKKLGFSYKDAGRITLTTFLKLYNHYKNDFDLELMLKKSHTTYAALKKKALKSEEWF
jgi:hypothetical protein